MRLSNRIALITGAASGIGRATAEMFVKEGAKVIIADINSDGAAAVAASLGASAIAVAGDVSKPADAAAMVEVAGRSFGRLDVLVNNAGFGRLGTVETTDIADWQAVLDVNLNGVFLCSRYAVPLLRSGGGGSIINLASTISVVGIPNRAAYVAAKGAVAALTRAMAIDHAKDGIRVNSIAPGVINSAYYDAMLKEVADPDAFIKGLNARSPVNRMGTSKEIASAIVFLASDESSFATGSMMTIDGGYTAW